MATKNAIQAKQLLLREAGQKLKVDGIEGPKTKAAITRVPALKPSLDQMDKMFGEAARMVKLSAQWITEQELIALTNEVAKKVPFTASQIKRMVDLEAAKKSFDGVMHYQVDAINAEGARGLGQFFRGAWSAASQAARGKYVFQPYDMGWNNAEQNVHAVGFYMVAVINEANDALRKAGYKKMVTPSFDVVYTLYNQGSSFAVKAARTGKTPPLTAGVKQSPAATPIFARAAKEIYGAVT